MKSKSFTFKGLVGLALATGLAGFVSGCGTARIARLPEDLPLPPGMTREEYLQMGAEARQRQTQMATLTTHRAPIKTRYRGMELAAAPEEQARGPAVIALMDTAPLSPAATNLTVALWIRCDVLPSAAQSYAGIIGRYNPQSQAGSEWLMGIDNTGKVFLATTGGGTTCRINATKAITTGVWAQVCGDWRPNGQATLYLNGALQATATLQVPTPGATTLLIGDVQPADGSHYFAGCVDEVRVWSKAVDTLFVTNLYKTAPDTDGDGIRDVDDPDDNNDGIPDAWAYEYFGDRLAGNPNEDPDRDSYNNGEEYVAGTNPNDDQSYFMAWNVSPTNMASSISKKGVRIECVGMAGRAYQLYASPQLKDAKWTADGSSVACISNGIVNLAVPATNKMSYYTVRVRMK